MNYEYTFVENIFGMSPFDDNPDKVDPIITVNKFVDWTNTTVLFLKMNAPSFDFIYEFLDTFEESGCIGHCIKITIEQLSKEYNDKYAEDPDEYDIITPSAENKHGLKVLYQNIIDEIEPDYKELNWKEGEIEKIEKFLKELKSLV